VDRVGNQQPQYRERGNSNIVGPNPNISKVNWMGKPEQADILDNSKEGNS
jgi:hypothetical protein